MAGSLRADPIYPDVVNTSHATSDVAAFFKSYFTTKSEHIPVATSDHFSEAHLTYIDDVGHAFLTIEGPAECRVDVGQVRFREMIRCCDRYVFALSGEIGLEECCH